MRSFSLLIFSVSGVRGFMDRGVRHSLETVLDMPAVSPQADPNESSRLGHLRKVSMSGDWGSNPYPINSSNIAPLDISQGNGGDIFTDDSSNGFRIRKALLDMHNYVRKLEAPAAKYMTKLIWDFHLEAYSREWANYLCSNSQSQFFDHSPNKASGIPTWPYRISTGENLYTSSAARTREDDYSDVVSKWYAERTDFNWSTGKSNDPSKPIGHWKQLVRPQATAVGCTVISNCHGNEDSAWKTYVVCHYDYGNIGTLPYQVGTGDSGLCQNCPAGFGCCEAGLCTGRADLASKSLAPYAASSQKTDEWYGCATFQRGDCENTGAVKFTDKVSGDDQNLEFQQCSCGSENPLDFQNVVNHGYFYFRNQCYQALAEATDDNSDVNSIYAMSMVKSKVQKLPELIKSPWKVKGIYIDKHHEAASNPALELKGSKSKAPSSSKVDFTKHFKESIKPLHVSLTHDNETAPVKLDLVAAENVKLKLDQDNSEEVKFALEGSDARSRQQRTPKEALKGDIAVPPSLSRAANDVRAFAKAETPQNVNEALDGLEVKAPPPHIERSQRPSPQEHVLATPPPQVNSELMAQPPRLEFDSP